jgi:hypothetical protein
MKINIRNTKKEAIRIASSSDVVIPYGQVYAVVPKKDYYTFLEMMYNEKKYD